jgi:hypothetical protein
MLRVHVKDINLEINLLSINYFILLNTNFLYSYVTIIHKIIMSVILINNFFIF